MVLEVQDLERIEQNEVRINEESRWYDVCFREWFLYHRA